MPAADDRLADFHAVPLLHEGDVVDDKDLRFADRSEILDDPIRADQPIAAAVKGPCAAKGAVPRTASRELDRGTRIERAEKIFASMAEQVARRQQIIERLDKAGRRSLSRCGDRTWNRSDIPSALDRIEKQRQSRLALAFEDAVDRPRPVLDQRACGERGAVSSDADKSPRQPRLRRLCKI